MRPPRRFLQVSVPPAPPALEEGLPYLRFKRAFDAALAESGLSYRIVRPTMMFAPGDVLLTVMLRTIHRYRFFPMFGDGEYHLSPIAADDVARILALQAAGQQTGPLDFGGPERWRYRDLTDLLFRALARTPRYWRLSRRSSVTLARLLQSVGSSLLYAYEVEWLMSDLLGLRPTSELDRPLARVEPFVRSEAGRYGSARGAEAASSGAARS